MTEKKLLELKKEIEEAKNVVAELKGQRTALMTQLKEEWGCTTIEAADKKVKDLEKQIKDLTTNIETGLEELERQYPV